ncbi:glycosyltransferase family 9 protein [Candidatus Latescibacterota bacterium]
MNGSWRRGTYWERAVLKWKGAIPRSREALDIFGELDGARKILIAPNDRVGGLFIGAPIYKALRHHYPEAEIQLLADETKADLARQIPFIDGVHTTELHRPLWSAGFHEAASGLRRQQFDLAFCLGPDCSFRLAQLCGACGARLRVGFRRSAPGAFNVEIVRSRDDVYEGDQYLIMLGLLGMDGRGEVRWTISQDRSRQLRSRYLDGEFSSGNVVGIDLGSGEGQGLSGRQLDDIVGRVIERGARAVLFFSLAERKHVNYLKKTYGNRILAFEQDDLAGVAALLEGCRALIACNTDLLHLAISLQVPAVGILYEDPKRWISPHNEFVEVVEARDIRAISIAQVVQALDKTLRPESREARP